MYREYFFFHYGSEISDIPTTLFPISRRFLPQRKFSPCCLSVTSATGMRSPSESHRRNGAAPATASPQDRCNPLQIASNELRCCWDATAMAPLKALYAPVHLV